MLPDLLTKRNTMTSLGRPYASSSRAVLRVAGVFLGAISSILLHRESAQPGFHHLSYAMGTPYFRRARCGFHKRTSALHRLCVATDIAVPPQMDQSLTQNEINMRVLNAARLPEDNSTMNPLFGIHKVQVLDRTLRRDKSPKGFVDARVVDILDELNRREEFVTTSSCSGRVFFMGYGEAGQEGELVVPDITNKTGRWRRVSHDGISDPDNYFNLDTEPLCEARGNLWLKVQPFSLDVACASAADAHRLVAVAREVYQRGASIIVPEREWRTVVNIEGPERLEMPFTLCGQQVYSGSLHALASLVNAKLAKNWARMDRLLEAMRRSL